MRRIIGLGLAMTLMAGAARADEAQEKANIELALSMWRGVIEQADVSAVLRYISPAYIQHNVNIAPGREGLLEGVKRLHDLPPGTRHTSKRLLRAVAQGDLVVLVWDQDFPDPKTQGQSKVAHSYVGQSFDMFRIKDGQIVEHWDDTRKTP